MWRRPPGPDNFNQNAVGRIEVVMLSRLETLDTELASSLREASTDELKRIAIAVCRFVCQEVGEVPSAVKIAIDQIGVPASRATVAELQRIVEELDDRYFTLDETGTSKDVVIPAFRRARAANAVLFALGGDKCSATDECIYEAAIATNRIERIREIVKTEKA